MARRGQVPWDQAFSHYAAAGPSRSYRDVARTFAVSERSVRVRARRDDWQHRVADMDAEAARRAEEAGVRSLELRMRDVIRLSELTRSQYAQHLRDGYRPTAADVVAMSKLELVLAGEATERTEVGVHGLVGEIAEMSSEELWRELREMRAADAAIEATEQVVPEMTMGPPPLDDE